MVTLTLGGVVFDGFEVPESINSGGSQMLVVHKLIGGTRVIDSMGFDDEDIHWSGRFRGQNAEDRALLLDFMRREGQQVLLTYSLHRYQVVIKEFRADLHQQYEIPYSITCTVILDETQGVASFAAGFVEAILTDVTKSLGLSDAIGSDTVAAAVTGVVQAVSNYQAGVPTSTNLITGSTAIGEAPLLSALQTSITGAQAATSVAIASNTIAPLPSVGSAPSAIAASLSSAANSLSSLTGLYQLSSTLGRMAINTNSKN